MRFTKMQAIGNDFVLVDAALTNPQMDFPGLARTVCARQFGIGADGLLVVSQSVPPTMRMFNPDGTEDMCGNGLRCAGLWMHRAGWVTASCFSIATREGNRHVEILDVTSGLLRLRMGVPSFAARDIPFTGDADLVIAFPIRIDGKVYEITSLQTGSAHTVILGEAPDEETFLRVSPLIEHHSFFPERTSVLWATPSDSETLRVRIWERGVGETLGCGTGACAVAAAAQIQGVVGNAPVNVVSQGGTLQIEWSGMGQEILMTGPAQSVFEGEFSFGQP